MSEDSPSAPSLIGCLIGDRYRLEKLLASGGMGDVFLAIDNRLGKRVALKLLKGNLVDSESFLERFQQEVQVCTHLESPHIVQVNDYGITGDGKPFYVMEYLQGETLGACLRRKKQLSLKQSLQIILQVCAGLQVAHSGIDLHHTGGKERRKIVHRDLKPDNIFLIPLASGLLVKILDFGIAKICYEELAEQTRNLTGSQVFLGTARYAAPEQISRQSTLDERVDIYSLGVILYEMLSGVDPFGFNQQQPNWLLWAVAHTANPVVPLRSQPGCENLPPELESAVLRCLDKFPQNRFATATELGQALNKIFKTDHYVPTPTVLELPALLNNASPAASPPPPQTYHRPTDPPEAPEQENLPTGLTLPAQMPPIRAAAVQAQPAVPPPPSTPPSTPSSVPLTVSPALQDTLERVLLRIIGPIAPVVLQETLQETQNVEELTESLIKQLPLSGQIELRQELQRFLSTPQVQSSPASPPSRVEPERTPSLDPDFIARCEQELAYAIGPIATFLVQDLLAEVPPPSPQKLIQSLAANITDPKKAAEFRQRMAASL